MNCNPLILWRADVNECDNWEIVILKGESPIAP